MSEKLKDLSKECAMNFDPTDDVFIRADKLGIKDAQVGIERGVPYWKAVVDGVTNSMSWPARVNGQPFSALSHFSMFLDSYEETLKNRAAQNPLEKCVEWCAKTFTSEVKEFLINGSRFELAKCDAGARWYHLSSNKEVRLLFEERVRERAWVAFVGTCRCVAGDTPAEALRGALDHQRSISEEVSGRSLTAKMTADLLKKILCGES